MRFSVNLASEGNEHAWDVNYSYAFLNVKYSFSSKIAGRLFVCLSAVGLGVTSCNNFFLLRALFFDIDFRV